MTTEEHLPGSTEGVSEVADDRRWLSPGVGGIGAASLFSDTGYELTTAVLPSFLSATLHAGAGALGIVEGVSDAFVGLAKLAGGPLAIDPVRRGRIASGGYLGTALFTGAIGLAGAVWQVGVLRALAWTARGIRSPARDALLTSLVPRHAYGRALGLERAGDNSGAVLGPLLGALLITLVGIRHALELAAIPGALAAGSITVAAREARRRVGNPVGRKILSFNLRELHREGLSRALVAPGLFEFGNIAATFLILRATDLLHSGSRSLPTATSLAIVLYAAYNAAATASSLGGGHLVDRIGPRTVFAVAAVVVGAAYVLAAAGPRNLALLLVAFLLAGTGVGFAGTTESTVVAQMLPDHLRPNGFGLLGLVQAAGGLASSAVVGLLWITIAPSAAFGYAAAWMVAAFLASGMLNRPQ